MIFYCLFNPFLFFMKVLSISITVHGNYDNIYLSTVICIYRFTAQILNRVMQFQNSFFILTERNSSVTVTVFFNFTQNLLLQQH